MKNKNNYLILLVSGVLLYFILSSESLPPSIVLSNKESLIVAIWATFGGALVACVSNIRTKKLENEIQKQFKLMDTIINNSSNFLCLRNTSGDILMVNDSLADLIGLGKEELVGKSLYDYFDDGMFRKEEDEHIINKKEKLVIETMLHPKGQPSKWFKLIKSPIFNDKGDVALIFTTVQDLSEEKEIDENKAAFVATLTHDLKTPTISQIKSLDFLLSGRLGELNAPQSDLITQIKKSCDYMYGLVFSLLDTYLYDNGQIALNLTKFDMQDLYSEVMFEIFNMHSEKDRLINFECTASSRIIEADRFQIKRVIINLISNAMTHGYRNEPIEILLTNSEDGNIVFEVKNKSNVIPEETMKEIFNKFKTKPSTKLMTAQSSLGLYLSNQIIEVHNGAMTANCNDDGVCTFAFSLPPAGSSTEVNQPSLNNTL